MWDRLWRHRNAVAMALGLVLAVAPLLITRVLPFHDSPGIVGLGGALALRDDPAAAIRSFYDIDVRAYPSALYFGWAYLAGAIGIPIDAAFALFMALFCVAALPLSMWLMLRAFHRPAVLALLVFPVSYHHQIWYGFLGSSAAVAGLVLALAFARRILDRPSLGNHAGLTAALLYVAAAHPFPLALTLAVVAPLLCWPPPGAPGRKRTALLIAARLSTLLPTMLFLGNWAAGFFGRGSGQRSLLKTITTSIDLGTPAWGDAGLYLDWLGNGYRSSWDGVVPGLALLTLAVLLATGVGVRPPAAEVPAQPQLARAEARRDWIVLGWAAAVLLAGYLFLPMKLVWPELWWGVRVRCVLPSYLMLLALVRPRARGPRPWLVAPAFATALVFFGCVTWDFARYFRGRVLAGFDDAVAAIPAGQSVLAFPVRPDPHYTLAHPYLVQHHVARKGGRAVPHLRGHPGSYWITMKPPPESPPWGDPRLFDWNEHSHWDYFLIEQPLQGDPVEPMRQAPPGAVRRVFAQGQFEVWQNLWQNSSHKVAPDPQAR
jgi:hypothetical protein